MSDFLNDGSHMLLELKKTLIKKEKSYTSEYYLKKVSDGFVIFTVQLFTTNFLLSISFLHKNADKFLINISTSVCVEDTIKQEPKDHSSREWVSPVPEVEVGGSAPGGPYVRARKDIPRGARFGPFLGKWASEPFNPRYAWEVSRAHFSVRGIHGCVWICVYVFIVSARFRILKRKAVQVAIVKRIGRCSISSN